MSWYSPADIGYQTRKTLAGWGHGARLLLRLAMLLPSSLRRFGLVRDQIFFLGNYSLAIITVSGLFVGFVLGLQGYNTLQRYGSSEAPIKAVTVPRAMVKLRSSRMGRSP
jgi:phospholipid/cholesterol/gamma-HCH transport system permease protein